MSEFSSHRFVGQESDQARAPHEKWMREHVPADCMLFRATERLAQEAAVRAGVGIGFVTNMVAAAQLDLEVVLENCEVWQSHMWLVTHVDLHRTAKVQAILKALKSAARAWQSD